MEAITLLTRYIYMRKEYVRLKIMQIEIEEYDAEKYHSSLNRNKLYMLIELHFL